ncbi:MAG: MBL fold metallo-hydrolase [Bradymonadaceae bacterium]
MNLIFWGTRGGIPVSGTRFIRHGGATTCVEVNLESPDPETPARIIIDCGTGLAEMGKWRGSACEEGLILQTHMHWDHIQGFPFFSALFNPASQFDFWAVPREGRSLRDVLDGQMCRPTFPVGLDIIPARLGFEDIPSEGSRWLGEVRLSWTELWHPGGSTAYRIDYRGGSIVFTGDVEVQQGCRDGLVEFARGADVLVMDAQYFPAEYVQRRGFGHSTVLDALDVARDAGVARLLMTHHDPTHDDARLEEKLAMARQARCPGLAVDNAHDGLHVSLGSRADVHAGL